MNNIKLLLFLIIFAVSFHQTKAQVDSSNVIMTADTIAVLSDSVFLSTETVIVSKIKNNSKRKNPKKAVLFSLLPGAGQAYNEQYWKIPIFYGAFGYAVYKINSNNKQYKRYLNGLIEKQNNVPQNELRYFPDNPDEEKLKRGRDKFRRKRDLAGILFLAVYSFNLIDASVYAHLSDFDVSEDLTLNIKPEILPIFASENKNTIGLTISLKF